MFDLPIGRAFIDRARAVRGVSCFRCVGSCSSRFECLTGTPPFGGRPSMRVLFAHLQEEPPDLPSQRRDVSPAAARAISRALEKEPEERPSSAGEYVSGIARAAGIAL
jgi:serine/threonine protein kinase